MLPILRKGSKGGPVELWQTFLIGRGYAIVSDGDFGNRTHRATQRYQRSRSLKPDGVVGGRSYGAALQDGFSGVEVPGADWPAPPTDLKPYSGNARRARAFGSFDYKPKSDKGEAIVVDPAWVRANITRIMVPQLRDLGLRRTGQIRVHVKAADPVLDLFQAWEVAGLLDHVLTWNGSYVPRFIRGSRKTLSNHAFGTAFDINVAWNRLGTVPALRSEHGSVRELVKLANKHGFYWGGHYRKRKDGMHFELARRTG